MQSLIPPLSVESSNAAIHRMLGDASTFFRDYWRKHPYYAPNTASEFSNVYGVEQYLVDLASVLPSPYLAVSVRDGKRFFTKHETTRELHEALLAGGVSAIKTS